MAVGDETAVSVAELTARLAKANRRAFDIAEADAYRCLLEEFEKGAKYGDSHT